MDGVVEGVESVVVIRVCVSIQMILIPDLDPADVERRWKAQGCSLGTERTNSVALRSRQKSHFMLC